MAEPPLTIADLVTDPDGTLKRAREAGAVAKSEIGSLLVVRHAAVRALGQSDKLRPAFSRVLAQFGVSSGPFFDWMSASPLDMEGDEHRAWRQIMHRAFTPRSVERLRPFLRAEAERLIDGFLPLGRCDFVEAYARRCRRSDCAS